MNHRSLIEQISANANATEAKKAAPKLVNLAAMSHDELVALAESSVGRNIALQDLLLRADTLINNFAQKLGTLSAEHVELEKEAADLRQLVLGVYTAKTPKEKTTATRHLRAWCFKRENGAK